MNPIKKIVYGLIKKLKFLPAAFYARIHYEYYTGKKLNLSDPVEFNEKIHWIKVFYRPDILTKLADKFEVREYIKDQIGKQYLNEVIAVYEDISEVDFDQLPDQFVLKATHGSNYNLIVEDKSKLDKQLALKLIRKWLSRNYYYRSGQEWAYKNMPKRVIAEKFLKDDIQQGLDDFKFFCFNGKPRMIQVDMGRSTNHVKCFYDLEWQFIPISKGKIKSTRSENKKPENLEEMIDLATKLSRPFPFVRVDFYSVNGQVYFGELTFYPGDGRTEFYPDAYNRQLGSYIELPEIPKGKKFIDSLDPRV